MEILDILKKKIQTASRLNSQSISISILEANDIFAEILKKDEEIISLQKKLINKKEDVINLKINPNL